MIQDDETRAATDEEQETAAEIKREVRTVEQQAALARRHVFNMRNALKILNDEADALEDRLAHLEKMEEQLNGEAA